MGGKARTTLAKYTRHAQAMKDVVALERGNLWNNVGGKELRQGIGIEVEVVKLRFLHPQFS
jgi:hypothetical protein